MLYSPNKIEGLTQMLAGTFGIDVAVIGEKLQSIAGTEHYRTNIGLVAPNDSHAAFILKSGETVFVDDLKSTAKCHLCEKHKYCPFTMGLYSPIVDQGQVRGVICFLASNSKQRKILLDQRQDSINYLNISASLISDHIMVNTCQKRNDGLQSMFNGLGYGVLILDNQGIIRDCNKASEILLDFKAKEAIGCHVDQIIPGISLNDLNKSQIPEIQVEYFSNSLLFTSRPIYLDDQIVEYVLLVKQQLRTKHFTLPSISPTTDSFSRIITNSESISRLKKHAEKVAVTDSTILLLGETGTGKELFAEAIHRTSLRKRGPMVAVNCSALPENLLESELFGYEEGSFTGAKKGGKQGKFQLANNGTLFLDEIGEMPLLLQAKMLRVLETGMVEKLGAKEPELVNVRIIAATNQDLKSAVDRGTFRKDLYFRLNVIPMYIPPLRERKPDIPLLISHFLNHFTKKYDSPVKNVHPLVFGILANYHWPGNIRELKNTIEYLVNTASDETAGYECLPPNLKTLWQDTAVKKVHALHSDNLDNAPRYEIETHQLHCLAIEEALRTYGTSTEGKMKAAKHLGISLATLYRRMKTLGIKA
jgi:transcriptional regulator with PAS, ATPase and Fis domain